MIHLLLKPGTSHLQNRLISSLTIFLCLAWNSWGGECYLSLQPWPEHLQLGLREGHKLWSSSEVWISVKATFCLLEFSVAANNTSLSEVHFILFWWGGREGVFSFFFFLLAWRFLTHRGNVCCHAQSSALVRPGAIILPVQSNVEQIRLRLTELVLHDGSLYPQQCRQTAAASRGPSSLPALPVSNAPNPPNPPPSLWRISTVIALAGAP